MNNPLRPAGLSIKRDQVWRSDLVRSACNAADLNPGSIIFLYKTLQSEVSSKDTWEQLLQNFIGARTKLKFDKSLTLVQALAVYGYAVNILKLTNVSPERSKLSFLYDDLWVSLADRYKDSGHLFLYDWYRALAHIQPGTLPLSSTIDLDAACTQHFATLSDHGPPSELVREIWQSRMQGFSLHAWKLASLPKILEGNASESNIDFLTWEKAVVSCQISKDVSALASLARDKRTEFTAGQQSLAWLWALALPQKDATMMIQETVAKLKRRTGLSLANTRSLQLCNALHLAFDPKVPIHNRMEDLGIAASKIGELASLELQIVAFLSVMRTLFKLRQHNLVNCCLVRYESLSAVCSNGATSDIFSLTEEIRSSQPNYRKPSPVASNILSRGGRLAGVSLEISRILGPLRTLKLVKGNYKNISLTQEETIACAQLLGQCLSDLHGPIAKFGQLLGHYLGVTSHPLGKALSVLHDSNTPVPFIDIERILAKEFNAPLHSLFKRIQPEPVGVGTVAQVHRATTIQGEEVALKIKLPGIKQVFINDLRVLGAITPILKILLPHIDFQGIYTEIRRGLFSEIDFAREVEMQKRLAIMFSNDPDIAIPKLFPEFCSDSVIGLEFIDGKSFTDFAATAPQKMRDRMGAATVRFVVTSMVKGCFNSDPNPGNFMFTDHKAYFIDYGCVHEINRTQRVYSTLLIRSILDQDLANYKTSAHMMGFVRDAKTFDFEAAFRAFTSARMGMWAEDKVQPIDMTKLVESFINMTTFSKNVADPQVGLRPKKFSYRFPPEFFFFFREYFGHLLLLSVLKAENNWHQIVRGIIDEHGLKYPEDLI